MDPLRYALGLALMVLTLLVMALMALFAFSPGRRRSGSRPETED
ncbi:hypothetical protein [Pseudarthrobacter sp. NIBRBAC000502770]|nr:hypothetical protein [Pseudarthrobacter sp. NIBRBAC000502770]